MKTLDGGDEQAVTSSPAQESYPRWSPDGTAVTYVNQEFYDENDAQGTVFLVRRANGKWGAPIKIRDRVSTMGAWMPDGLRVVYAREGTIELIPVDGTAPRVVYAPASSALRARSVNLSEDGQTVYFKSLDPDGRSTIWSMPLTGGKPRPLVRFVDSARPSIRPDFAVGAGRVFFTLEDRQADIWVAEVSRR